MSETSFEIDRTQKHLGPIWLVEGIGPRNVLALFYCAMMTIVYVTAISVLWPFLLEEQIQLDAGIAGNFTANVTVLVEIITILVAVPIGLLSDRIGRRRVFASAFVIMAIACFLMPFAGTVWTLAISRVLIVLGFAAGTLMLGTIIADYPQNATRGKLISINGVITGLGVAIFASFVFGQMPKRFVEAGFEPIQAGTYTLWIMALIAALTALIALFGIKDVHKTEKEKSESFKEMIQIGGKAVRKNARLSIAAAAYFVSRGDLVVMTTFFTLWIFRAGIDAGLDSGEAQTASARLFGISQLAMIFFIPIMGYLLDKFDRVSTLALALGVASFGYFCLGLVDSPYGTNWIYFVAIAAGAGEACVIVSGPALVGQEAPPKIRGSIFGFMLLMGATGILIHTKICGLLFDGISYQAPFVYMAIVNGLICVAAIWVRLRIGPKKKTSDAAPSTSSAQSQTATSEALSGAPANLDSKSS